MEEAAEAVNGFIVHNTKRAEKARAAAEGRGIVVEQSQAIVREAQAKFPLAGTIDAGEPGPGYEPGYVGSGSTAWHRSPSARTGK